MLFYQKYWIQMSHIASILGKISYNGLENNLNDSYANEA